MPGVLPRGGARMDGEARAGRGTGRRRLIAWAPNASRIMPGDQLRRAACSQLGRLADILREADTSDDVCRSLVV